MNRKTEQSVASQAISVEANHSDVLSELEKINVSGTLSRADMAELRRLFGARFTAAWKLVKQGRVKKYVFKPSGRVQWIVVGNKKDYLIYEAAPYCHCTDFYQAVIDGRAKACKHLVAQRLATQLGLFVIQEESDEHYFKLLEEWRIVEEQ